MTTLVLEIDAVTKTYPSQPPVQALRGVSFAVRQGELVAIVGPSGSGKTTLLHVMGTLDLPSAGTVRLTGLDVAALPDRELSALRATQIGFVFQQFFLAAPRIAAPARLRPADLGRVASVGLRTRKLRAGLSALGIAIGVAAIVAVLGLSASSSAGLLAEIGKLGTNLLTVTPGKSLGGQTVELPTAAPAMIARIGPVTQVEDTGSVTGVDVYRSPLIPAIDTNALGVQAASLGLLPVVRTSIAQGHYLNAATAREPVALLGAVAAHLLGIDRVFSGERIWLGGSERPRAISASSSSPKPSFSH